MKQQLLEVWRRLVFAVTVFVVFAAAVLAAWGVWCAWMGATALDWRLAGFLLTGVAVFAFFTVPDQEAKP